MTPDDAKSILVGALELIEVKQADLDTFDHIMAHGGIFIASAAELGISITPALWKILALTTLWLSDRAGRLDQLDMLYGHIASLDTGEAHDLAIIEYVLAALLDIETAQTSEWCEAFVGSTESLARLVLAAGDPDRAYNIISVGIQFGPPPGIGLLAAVDFALQLAIEARRPHQIAVCSSVQAICEIVLADERPHRRLRAFDACERAIERIRDAPQPFQEIAATQLHVEAACREYLRLLLPALLLYMPGHPAYAELLRAAPRGSIWPDRITRLSIEELPQQLANLALASPWLSEVDKDRQKLEPMRPSTHAHVSWIDWTLDHPAYRRAVQQGRSFLREKHFAKLFTVLTHEATHALSLAGGLGLATTALRAAALDVELGFWAQAQVDVSQVNRLGEPESGKVLALFQVEQQLEMSLKLQSVMDVWMPWLEGLAIFAESAADPALEETRIGTVANILRNLVDFMPDAQDASKASQIEAFVAEFEDRCSEAMRKTAPRRLFDLFVLDEQRRFYLSGYLAVRSVVSAWRRRYTATLNGPQAFELLLHATRFGTLDAVPDLSLGAEAFAAAAEENMLSWMTTLAELPEADIAEFLRPTDRAAAAVPYCWAEGRVRHGERTAENTDDRVLKAKITQAMGSLLAGADIERFAGRDALLLEFVDMLASKLWERQNSEHNVEAIDFTAEVGLEIMARQAFLPIGRAEAIFSLNFDPESADRIYVHFRTTEAHQDTGQPSTNALSFALDHADAEAIRTAYQQDPRPRLTLTRLMDLGGQLSASAGVHVLAFQYGGEVQLIQLANPAFEPLRADADRWAAALSHIKSRLTPKPMTRVETRLLANGDAVARRALDWLDGATTWDAADYGVDVDPWVALVRRKAERLLDAASRMPFRLGVARSMLGAAVNDRPLAALVLDDEFKTVVDATDQGPILEALAATGRLPAAAAWLDENQERLARTGFWVFEKTNGHWDVRTFNKGQQNVAADALP